MAPIINPYQHIGLSIIVLVNTVEPCIWPNSQLYEFQVFCEQVYALLE